MSDFQIIEPRFKTYVLGNAPLEKLGEGFRWAEGPVWFGDMGMLLFSDLPSNRVMRWSEVDGIQVFRTPSDFANGHARDRQGRLITCSHHGRSLTRLEHDGSITVLANRSEGRRLNAPNDVVVKSDGDDLVHRPALRPADGLRGGASRSRSCRRASSATTRAMRACAWSPTNSMAPMASASRRTRVKDLHLRDRRALRRASAAGDPRLRRRSGQQAVGRRSLPQGGTGLCRRVRRR